MLKKVSDNAVECTVFLSPGASKETLNGITVDENGEKQLRVSVFAHAQNNKANISLIKLLSKYFNVPKSNVKIKSGLKSRRKVVFISDLDVNEAIKKISADTFFLSDEHSAIDV